MNILRSFGVVVKYSFVLVVSTVCGIGIILNNEAVAGISGIIILAFVIYRKVDQLYKQYSIFKKIPKHIRDMVAGGDLENIYKGKEEVKNSDNRGSYQ